MSCIEHLHKYILHNLLRILCILQIAQGSVVNPVFEKHEQLLQGALATCFYRLNNLFLVVLQKLVFKPYDLKYIINISVGKAILIVAGLLLFTLPEMQLAYCVQIPKIVGGIAFHFPGYTV